MDISSAAYRTHQQRAGQSAADTFYYSITPMQTPCMSIALSHSLALNPEIYTRGERTP